MPEPSSEIMRHGHQVPKVGDAPAERTQARGPRYIRENLRWLMTGGEAIGPNGEVVGYVLRAAREIKHLEITAHFHDRGAHSDGYCTIEDRPSSNNGYTLTAELDGWVEVRGSTPAEAYERMAQWMAENDAPLQTELGAGHG